MRTFIALPIPENIKDYLRDMQAKLKVCDLHAKWVNADNIHMTLKFLGDIDEEQVPSLSAAIKEVASSFVALSVNLTEFGFFPNERNPRVFFIATDKEELLQKIAYTLEEKLEPLGFKKEHRFRSHLTLSRFKDKKNINRLVEKIRKITVEKSFAVDEIILYRSTLTPKGPIYDALLKTKLLSRTA